MRVFVLVVLVVVLTALETVVSTWESRADRQVGPPGTEHFAKKAALWAAVFEGLLYAGMYLVVAEHVWLAVPGVIAAGVSKLWACLRRIKKWKPRKKKDKPRSRRARLAESVEAPTSTSSSTSAASLSPTASETPVTPDPRPVTP